VVRRHRHWCTRDGRDVRESASGEDVTYIPRLGLRHDLTMSDNMNDVGKILLSELRSTLFEIVDEVTDANKGGIGWQMDARQGWWGGLDGQD
jgi:hypothetical protein